MYSYTLQEIRTIRDALERALFELEEREDLMTGTEAALLEAIEVLDGVVAYTDQLEIDLILAEASDQKLRGL